MTVCLNLVETICNARVHTFQYMFKLVGGTPEDVPEVYKARSPVFNADKIKEPLLVRSCRRYGMIALVLRISVCAGAARI